MMFRIFVIILVFGSLLLPACKKDAPTARSTMGAVQASFEDLIEEHVEDKGRRARLLLLVDKNRQTFADVKIAFLDMTDKLRSDPQGTREEADVIMAEFKVLRDKAFGAMVSRRMEMRTFATQEEWNAVHAALEEQANKQKEKSDKK